MCKGKALIAVKGSLELVWDEDINHHEPLVEKHGLKDDKEFRRNFVRLEAKPLGRLDSLNPDDWAINTDEANIPIWFDEAWASAEAKRIMVTKIVPYWLKEGIKQSIDLSNTLLTSFGNINILAYVDCRNCPSLTSIDLPMAT